jgi:hypothetical protein
MRKETEHKVNQEAASYNFFICGSSVNKTKQTFYHAIETFTKALWHKYTEQPKRGQRIVMIHNNEIGGGVYVGKGQVEECGVRRPMMCGCKWCYLCDIYEQE